MTEFLKKRNRHSRDKNIVFIERGHKYHILTDMKSKYISVTTWLHSLFPTFDADAVINKMRKGKNWGPTNKYWEKTNNEIKEEWNKNGKEVSEAGTQLHEKIENFMNIEMDKVKYSQKDILDLITFPNNNVEWNYFIKFVEDFPYLNPFRSEWMVYDEELKLSGSIDMVYINNDGTLSIYDWKRCKEIVRDTIWNDMGLNKHVKHLPNTNFWHYSLQLNLYKQILERNYGYKVKELYLVCLHPNNEKETYEVLEVPILDKEMNFLMEERINIINS